MEEKKGIKKILMMIGNFLKGVVIHVVIVQVAILVMRSGLERTIIHLVNPFDCFTMLPLCPIFIIRILTKAKQTFHLIKNLGGCVPPISNTNIQGLQI